MGTTGKHAAEITGPRLLRRFRDVAGDAASVPLLTFRTLGRHLPAVFVVALSGIVLRYLAIELAVVASGPAGFLGQLVLVFAPLSVLTSFILILRIVRPSLPHVAAPPQVFGETAKERRLARWRAELGGFGGLLVPFLVVYATSGSLRADFIQFAHGVSAETINESIIDAIDNDGRTTADIAADQADRLMGTVGITTAVIVVLAFAARTLLPWFIRHLQWTGLGLLLAYTEAVWLLCATPILNGIRNRVTSWLEGRRFVAWVDNTWTNLVDHLGPFAVVVQWVLDQFLAVIGGATALLVVPLSWLAMGAVVFGQLIEADTTVDQRLDWLHRGRQHWSRLDGRVRKVAADFSGGLSERFGQLAWGLRLMFSSGLFAMAIFCLLFQGAQFLTGGLWLLERRLIGPGNWADLGVWQWIDGPLGMFNDAVTTSLLLCLVAAGVDRAMRARQARVLSGTAEQQPADPSSDPTGDASARAEAQCLVDPSHPEDGTSACVGDP